MTIEVFIALLFASSVVTGLFTEAVKRLFEASNKDCPANLIAGISSAVIGGGICVWHYFYANESLSIVLVMYYIAFVCASWLCAMLGYDKVIQAVEQIAGGKRKF